MSNRNIAYRIICNNIPLRTSPNVAFKRLLLSHINTPIIKSVAKKVAIAFISNITAIHPIAPANEKNQ